METVSESVKKGAKPLPRIDSDYFQSGQAIHIFGQMFAAWVNNFPILSARAHP
jgi:hypothetical protein